LGWTQQEIANSTGLSQQGVSKITTFAENGKSSKDIQTFLGQGQSMEWICNHYSIDAQLAWAIRLQDKPDMERLGLLTEKHKGFILTPRCHDEWSFSKCFDLCGINEYPGRIPAQIVLNTLYYYTKQGDFVIDPMAGGGTTIDACLLMNRHCKGYDVNPNRQDIIEHNALHKFPDKNAKLIFLDPPYWSMKVDEYAESSISNLPLDEFYGAIAIVLYNTFEALKKGGYVAFLIQNQTEKDIPEGRYYLDHIYECMKIIEKLGFKFVRRISAPQSTQTFTPQQEISAKDDRRLLGVVRDLVIAVKE